MVSEAAAGAIGGMSTATDTTRGESPAKIPGSMDTPVPSDKWRAPPLRGEMGLPPLLGAVGAGVEEPGPGVGAGGEGLGVVLPLAGLGVGA